MVIAIDFETVPFSVGNQAPQPVCMSWKGLNHLDIETGDHMREVLSHFLVDNTLVMANAPFDMAVAAQHFPELFDTIITAYEQGRIKDVQTRQKLIDVATGDYYAERQQGYSLARLAKRWLNIDLEKEDSPRLDYERLLSVPLEEWPDTHVQYAKEDARVTLEVYLAQQREMEEDDVLHWMNDEDRQCRAHFALYLMSAWGLFTNQPSVNEMRAATEGEMDELFPVINKAGLVKFKKNGDFSISRKKAQELMFDTITDWSKVKLTPGGKKLKKNNQEYKEAKYVSVDKEAVEDANHPLLKKYARYSKLRGFLSGHLTALQSPIVHTKFDVLMETGRTSSSKPNVQNVRREVGARECFIPRPGHVFIGCDYDKAELHTLAQTCLDLFGESKLADVLNEGRDPHGELGEEIKSHAPDSTDRPWRSMAKPANFGLPGGLGAPGFQGYCKSQYSMSIDLETSKFIIKAWKKRWPMVVEYLKWVRSREDTAGFYHVKHFQSDRIRGRTIYTAACNSYFQGRAADGAKRALWMVMKECYLDESSPLSNCRPVNFIHDEILMEVPEDRYNEAAWRLRDVMVEGFNHFVQDVPVRATPCAMDVWSKDAETILNDSGELEVWRYGN